MTISLAFLAPDLVKAAIEGRLPHRMGVARLCHMPAEWSRHNTEFHVTFTGADNHFGAIAATPVQMLAQNWASVFTTPQTTENQLAFLTASASWKPTDTWTYQAIAYYRYFHQAHVDGNGTNASNDPTLCPDPTLLCFPNLNGTISNLMTTTGHTVANSGAVGFPNVLGEIDRTWTTTNSFGGSVQAASSEKLFNHNNNFTVGMSVRGADRPPRPGRCRRGWRRKSDDRSVVAVAQRKARRHTSHASAGALYQNS
jgi:hypothetical protein